MTLEEKIAYIISAVEDDTVVIKLLRMSIKQAIPLFEEPRLDVIIAVINT